MVTNNWEREREREYHFLLLGVAATKLGKRGNLNLEEDDKTLGLDLL